jgi:type IV pilus assembly protein PilB
MDNARPDDSDERLRLIAEVHGLEFVDLRDVVIPPAIVQLMPAAVVHKYTVLPLGEEDDVLKVLISDPLDYDTVDALRFHLNRDVRIALSTRKAIVQAIARYYGAE